MPLDAVMVRDLHGALRRDASHHEARLLLAQHYLQTGCMPEGRAHLDAYREAQPRDPQGQALFAQYFAPAPPPAAAPAAPPVAVPPADNTALAQEVAELRREARRLSALGLCLAADTPHSVPPVRWAAVLAGLQPPDDTATLPERLAAMPWQDALDTLLDTLRGVCEGATKRDDAKKQCRSITEEVTRNLPPALRRLGGEALRQIERQIDTNAALHMYDTAAQPRT